MLICDTILLVEEVLLLVPASEEEPGVAHFFSIWKNFCSEPLLLQEPPERGHTRAWSNHDEGARQFLGQAEVFVLTTE